MFKHVPAPTNFREDRDVGYASLSGSKFDQGAIAPGSVQVASRLPDHVAQRTWRGMWRGSEMKKFDVDWRSSICLAPRRRQLVNRHKSTSTRSLLSWCWRRLASHNWSVPWKISRFSVPAMRRPQFHYLRSWVDHHAAHLDLQYKDYGKKRD